MVSISKLLDLRLVSSLYPHEYARYFFVEIVEVCIEYTEFFDDLKEEFVAFFVFKVFKASNHFGPRFFSHIIPRSEYDVIIFLEISFCYELVFLLCFSKFTFISDKRTSSPEKDAAFPTRAV